MSPFAANFREYRNKPQRGKERIPGPLEAFWELSARMGQEGSTAAVFRHQFPNLGVAKRKKSAFWGTSEG